MGNPLKHFFSETGKPRSELKGGVLRSLFNFSKFVSGIPLTNQDGHHSRTKKRGTLLQQNGSWVAVFLKCVWPPCHDGHLY